MTRSRDALCCLISAVQDSAAQDDPDNPGNPIAEPFEHAYPSSSLTWPYCEHHFVTGRSLPPTTLPPQNALGILPADDPQTTGRILYNRFDLDIGRCGPPAADEGCLGSLYGDCTSPAGHDTLAGHERAVDEEMNRLVSELLDRWCDCMVANIAGYPRHAPRWMEPTATIETQGRFTVIRLQVGTRLG